MKFRFYFITLAILLFAFPLKSQQSPKREFRGAWIQTVHQSQYQNMDKATMQTYLTAMLRAMESFFYRDTRHSTDSDMGSDAISHRSLS